MGVLKPKPERRVVLQRNLRRQQRSVELASDQASQQIDRHIIRRWSSVGAVRRQIFIWLTTLVILCGGLFMQNRQLSALYRQETFVPGGAYTEGIVGTFTNINPIFASGQVDTSASRLVFASLLKYDTNNKLVGDLAEALSSDEKGTTYTVQLRQDLKWHDGAPLTSDDVAFTIATIQHPDTNSPFNPAWRGITVETPDERTVVFKLPVSLAPFPHSLTVGILPRHILSDTDPTQLRSHAFNTREPVGAGPFRFKGINTLSLDAKEVEMEPFDDYHGGKPDIAKFVIRSYSDQDSLLEGFRLGDVQGMAGLNYIQEPNFGRSAISARYVPLANGVYAFMKTTHPILSDVRIREALLKSADLDTLLNQTLQKTRVPLYGPMLRSQIAFPSEYEQQTFNPQAATQLLDTAGWIYDESDGVRKKDGQPLELRLVTQNSDEYSVVATELQKQWDQLGINIRVEIVSDEDMQQDRLIPHNYDILLYGINLGVDPDVHPYWHTKEAGLGGFNFSEYKSPTADASLEAGRTRTDTTLRSLKYKGFFESWKKDMPAIALYQPSYQYVQTAQLDGYTPHTLVSPADRFENVHNWKVKTEYH